MFRTGRSKAMAGAAAAALMLGTLAVGVEAQQRAGRRAGVAGMRAPLARMALAHGLRLPLGQLNLTAEQREKVQAILGAHRAESQSIRERAMPAQRALNGAIAAGDEAAVRQASAEVAAVQTDRALLAMRVRNEVWRILTPEQQQKAQELQKQFEGRVGRRMREPGVGR